MYIFYGFIEMGILMDLDDQNFTFMAYILNTNFVILNICFFFKLSKFPFIIKYQKA